MDDTSRSVQIAIGLMRMALALLEKAGQHAALPGLQHAIDTVLHHHPLQPSEELAPEAACLVASIPLSAP